MSMHESKTGMDRRDFIKVGGMSALALSLGAAGVSGDFMGSTNVFAETNDDDNVKLKFNSNGKFKIVQFNDTQDDERIDRRTIELMEKVLDAEKPDFVIHNGDNITGGLDSPLEVRQAINNVVQPMEQRNIKWAMTYGNHDEDSTPKSGLNEDDMLKIYMSYKHNMNKLGVKGITGTGNMDLVDQQFERKIQQHLIFGFLIVGDMLQRPLRNKTLMDTLSGIGFALIK